MINSELFKEVSPLFAKDCFILIERQKSNFNFPIHIHPECELDYIENAKGARRIVGDSIEECVSCPPASLPTMWLSNFNSIFKKKKGVTPSAFRENYRKNKTII